MRFAADEPIIYVITAGDATDLDFAVQKRKIVRLAAIAVELNISLIQIREKKLSARNVFELAAAVAAEAHDSSTRILVNDRADIAVAAGADGVHLTTNSIPADIIRKTFSKDLIIGVSAHTAKAAANASANGADFAVFGPVFDTPGKGEPHGINGLSEVCRAVDGFPIIGLGGVDESNCSEIIAAGARGVAAIRALNDPDAMRRITQKLRS
ncbi:MAG: thiamine phosphate synthase [Pyrinomonadaceae bacterium]